MQLHLQMPQFDGITIGYLIIGGVPAASIR